MEKRRLWSLCGLGILLLSAFLLPCSAFADELIDIQTAIQQGGARWVAGPTSISWLPYQDRQKRVGLILPQVSGMPFTITAP